MVNNAFRSFIIIIRQITQETLMARRRKKKMSRSMTWFVAMTLLAIAISIGILNLISVTGWPKISLNGFVVMMFTLIIVFNAMVLIFSIPTVKGWLGEMLIDRKLKSLTKRYGGYRFHNVMVQDKNGKTSQIDNIYVCRRGLFVIEVKNYAGRIYGDDKKNEWTQVLNYGRIKNKLYNPVKQNWTHIYRIKEYLNLRFDPVNVVVFVRGNTDYIDSDYVYGRRGFDKTIRRQDKILTDFEEESIAKSIQSLIDNPVQSNKEHVRQIKSTQGGINNGVCPRCGGALVVRVSKTNGTKFVGCSNYPKCKFIRK